MTDDILIKYITGQCTEEEKSEVLAWLKEDIDHNRLFELEQIWGLKAEKQFSDSSRLDKSDVIVVSCIGYATKEISVGNQSTIDVVLSEDTRLLDEVVVVGYGTQKKSDVSGSVTTVSGDKLTKMPTANAEAALQGMAPGYQR